MALNYGYNRRHLVFGTTSKGAPGAKGGTGSRGPKGNTGSLSTISADLDMNTNKITNMTAPTDDTDASTKEYVDYQIQSKVSHDGSTTMSADLDMSTRKIVNMGEPVSDSDASTKKYADQGDALTKLAADAYALSEVGKKVSLDRSTTMTGGLNMGSEKITWLADPTSAEDATNKKYVDSKTHLGYSNVKANVRAYADTLAGKKLNIDGSSTMTGGLDMGSNKVTSLATPTADTDASTKKYVDDNTVGSILDPNGGLNMRLKKIGNVGAPTSTLDATTKTYVDNLAGTKLNTNGSTTMTGNLTMGGLRVLSLGAPAGNTDASNKKYVDDKSASVGATASSDLAAMGVKKVSVDGSSVMSGGLDMGDNGITSLSDPTNDGDAANKKYVDSKATSGGASIGDTSKFVIIDKTSYKVSYSRGTYKTFSFTTSGFNAPYNGGYGTGLTVTQGDKARVPVVGEMRSVHIEQEPDSSGTAEIRVTAPMPNYYWKLKKTFGVVFVAKCKYAPNSIPTITLQQASSGITQDVKLLGVIGGYRVYLSRVIYDASVTPLTLTLSLMYIGPQRMVLDLYPGFVFDGIDQSKYYSASLSASSYYPTHTTLDHHKFVDSTVGDILVAGVQNTDGILTVDKLLITEKNIDTSPSSWFHTETGKSFVISLQFESIYRGVQSYTLHRTTLPPSTKITMITMAVEGSTVLPDKISIEIGAKFYVGGGSSSVKKLTTFGKRSVGSRCEGISYLGIDVAISPPASCIAFELYLEQADFFSTELTKKITMLVRVYNV